MINKFKSIRPKAPNDQIDSGMCTYALGGNRGRIRLPTKVLIRGNRFRIAKLGRTGISSNKSGWDDCGRITEYYLLKVTSRPCRWFKRKEILLGYIHIKSLHHFNRVYSNKHIASAETLNSTRLILSWQSRRPLTRNKRHQAEYSISALYQTTPSTLIHIYTLVVGGIMERIPTDSREEAIACNSG